MAFNVRLKDMIDALVKGWDQVEQKNMFGGISYMIRGHLAFGVYFRWLIVRVGEERASQSLGQPGFKLLDISGKPMKGWLMADESIWQTEEGLQHWILAAREFVASLPPAQK